MEKDSKQGTANLLDYLAQLASSGEAIEVPLTPERLGQYYQLPTEQVVTILDTLVAANRLTTQPNDRFGYTVPAYADIPTEEDIHTLETQNVELTSTLAPNPIQIIPLLTNIQAGNLFLGEPPTPEQVEQDKHVIDTFVPKRQDQWTYTDGSRKQ